MSEKPPWDDWIPGVLSNVQLLKLCGAQYISNVNPESIGESSLDLTISSTGYKTLKGSVKPSGEGRYIDLLVKNLKIAEKMPVQTEKVFLLERRKTYIFKLNEKLQVLNESPIYGQATAKSTIGRVDVLARLIVDGMDSYEGFEPKQIKSGDMFLEITPMTFDVHVREGTALSQLRLFMGKPEDSIIKSKELTNTILNTNSEVDDAYLKVDLSQIKIGDKKASAFCAKYEKDRTKPIDLWEKEKYDPCEYWKVFSADENGFIEIKNNEFYILRSKELISVPKGIAIYCRAIDETIGEMRIHYAGFVHPFFGKDRNDGNCGTPLIFEVRGHHINVCLRDEEKLAKIIFYRMSEDCEDNQEKKCKRKAEDDYVNQSLTLSKIFSKWPDKIKVSEDGTVEPLNN